MRRGVFRPDKTHSVFRSSEFIKPFRKKINNGGGRLSLSCPIVGRKSSLMSNAFAFVPRHSNTPRAGGVGGGDVEGRECSS
jgi:hypothetical protein